MEIHCWVTMTPTPKAIATSSRVWPSFGPCAHATPGNQGSELKKGTFRNWCWIQHEPFFVFRGKVILHLTPLCLSFEKRAYAFFHCGRKKKQWTLIMTFGISTVNAEGLPLPQKWLNIDDKLQYFTQYAPLLPLMKGCPTSSNLIRDWFSWTKLYVCLPVSKHTSRLVQSNQSSSICNAKSH